MVAGDDKAGYIAVTNDAVKFYLPDGTLLIRSAQDIARESKQVVHVGDYQIEKLPNGETFIRKVR